MIDRDLAELYGVEKIWKYCNRMGEITFLAEVHIKNDYLLIFNAWRQKKARRGTTV